MKRLIAALTVFVFMCVFIFLAQSGLARISEDLAEKADEVCAALSSEQTAPEGMVLLEELELEFERRRPILGIFVSDVRIHELQRALSRAKKLGKAGDYSPSLEALTDLSRTLRELSETHRPSWENILSFPRFVNLMSQMNLDNPVGIVYNNSIYIDLRKDVF